MRLLEAPASPAGARFPDVSGANGGMLLLRALKKMAGGGSRPVFGVFSILLASRPMAFRRAHILILERRMISKKTKGVAGLRKNCSAIARFWQTMLFLSHGCDTGALRFLSGFSLCRVSAIPSLPFPRPAFRAFHVFSRSADFSQAVFMLFFFFICYRRFFSLSFFASSSLIVLSPRPAFRFSSTPPPPCSAARVKVFLAGRRKCRIMSQC